MNPTCKNLNECGMINAVKELFDVRPPDETARLRKQEFLRPLNAGQKPLGGTTRPGIVDKSLIVNWNQVIVKQAMNQAIPNQCHGDVPLFVVTNSESTIRAMTVGLAVQFFMKFKKIPLKIVLQLIQFRRGFFPRAEIQPALPQIF